MAPVIYNLAVPNVRLLTADGVSRLSFAGSAWAHLLAFMDGVERLPANLELGSEPLEKALDSLRREAQRFGSPKAIRLLLMERPDALAASDGPPSPLLHVQLVWLVQKLGDSAVYIGSFLQTLLAKQGTSDDLKAALCEPGAVTEKARAPIGPLIDALRPYKRSLLTAFGELSAASRTEGARLQTMQERIGGLQVGIEALKKRIDALGFLSSKSHRSQLAQELAAEEQALVETSARADQMRAALAALEPVLTEGHWLESSLESVVGFLEDLRKLWTDFGSGLAQLSVDSAHVQLDDPSALRQALGLDAAIKQWAAIDLAAKQFTADLPGRPGLTLTYLSGGN